MSKVDATKTSHCGRTKGVARGFTKLPPITRPTAIMFTNTELCRWINPLRIWPLPHVLKTIPHKANIIIETEEKETQKRVSILMKTRVFILYTVITPTQTWTYLHIKSQNCCKLLALPFQHDTSMLNILLVHRTNTNSTNGNLHSWTR